VADILQQVHKVCNERDVPLTLKFRTGWSPDQKNALTIAKLAQDIGVSMLTLHGRTRACGYKGDAEYDTIAQVKQAVSIPVIANGDINSPEKAKKVLQITQADGLMIGRAAQGNPWIFREIKHYLNTGEFLPAPTLTEVHEVLIEHLQDHYHFYGEHTGLLTARKHLQWYLSSVIGKNHPLMLDLMQAQATGQQLKLVDEFFKAWASTGQLHFRPPQEDLKINPIQSETKTNRNKEKLAA
jgi:tRNA-dihydrouridine synthase B